MDPFMRGWVVDLRCRRFLMKMCVKTKELGPMGGGGSVRHKIFYVDPPMECQIQDTCLILGKK